MRVLGYIGLIIAGAIASILWLLIALVAIGIAVVAVAYVVDFLGRIGTSRTDQEVPAARQT
jgi:hypothetical protein